MLQRTYLTSLVSNMDMTVFAGFALQYMTDGNLLELVIRATCEARTTLF